MRRIFYYDTNMKFRNGEDPEIVCPGSLDESIRLVREEDFHLIGIDAASKDALEFATSIKDCGYKIIIFATRRYYVLGSLYDGRTPAEEKVINAMGKHALAIHDRSLKTRKNLKTLIDFLNKVMPEESVQLE